MLTELPPLAVLPRAGLVDGDVIRLDPSWVHRLSLEPGPTGDPLARQEVSVYARSETSWRLLTASWSSVGWPLTVRPNTALAVMVSGLPSGWTWGVHWTGRYG
jgi:hypothetical protein